MIAWIYLIGMGIVVPVAAVVWIERRRSERRAAAERARTARVEPSNVRTYPHIAR